MSAHESGAAPGAPEGGDAAPVEDLAMNRIDRKPSMPARYRKALYRAFPDLMGDEWASHMGTWLFHNRSRLVVGGGAGRYNWEILDLDALFQDSMIAELREHIVSLVTPELLADLVVDPFDLGAVEMHATLHHHGCWFGWHDDQHQDRDMDAQTRAVTFNYYLRSSPQMFSGGNLEFLDGSVVEPDNDALVLMNPYQTHRVTNVECWSRESLHGRWSITGWLHAAKPFRPVFISEKNRT